jgi:hypothetical protein
VTPCRSGCRTVRQKSASRPGYSDPTRELEASPVLPLFDIERALRERARRTQELAQEITFRRLRGLTPGQIREQLEIDDDWFVAAEALIFEGQQLVIEEMAACSPVPPQRSERHPGCLIGRSGACSSP